MSFEVFLTADGEPKWRLRGNDGQVLQVKPGRIRLPGNVAKNRRAKAAMKQVLTQIARGSADNHKA